MPDMRRRLAASPWLTALVSWIVATVVVAGGFALWQRSNGAPFFWEDVRDAALIAAPLALFRAWRDIRRGS